MNFTLLSIARSLAAYLSPYFPGVEICEGPNQQGTNPPCMFLQQRYSHIKKKTSGRYLRQIGLDLTYLVDYNLTNMQQLYQQAAETLDLLLDIFPYKDGAETALIRVYEREWRIDLDALHYKFELQVLVDVPVDKAPMRVMSYQEDIRNG